MQHISYHRSRRKVWCVRGHYQVRMCTPTCHKDHSKLPDRPSRSWETRQDGQPLQGFVHSLIRFAWSYLHECIGTHLHVRDKVFAVLVKFEHLDFVLEDQITQPSFGKSYAERDFIRHVPFDATRIGIKRS